MIFQNTTATRRVFSLKQRIRAVAGGTSASKTISILVWCIDRAQSGKNELISIVSESYPHLEKGAMLDFQNIMKDRGYWNQDLWHDTKHTYTFETGTKIEFLAVDTYGKAHGPRRDILFLNECNNLPYELADQLIIRTRKIVWMDWNPSSEFWFYTDMQPTRADIDFITLTYLENEALDAITVNEIESHRANKRWWQVYGLGQLGEVEGRIYTGWQIIDEIPFEARLEGYGLDFGYSNDPTAIVAIYYYNGGYILDEVAYKTRMRNQDIVAVFENIDQKIIIADSAEPKSIDELKLSGLTILPATKGKGSVNFGIDKMQSMQISITKRSVNGIKEYRNYFWLKDIDGHELREPEPGNDHFLDAARYRFEMLGQAAVPDLLVVGYEQGLGGVEIPVYDFN